jgi:hypothetical protein
MSTSNQLFNRIDAILDGIDRQEDDPKGGWWHTEDGARLGRIKLWELKEAIQEQLNRVCGVAPSNPAPLPTEEEIKTWLRLRFDSPVYLAEPDRPADDAPAYWADDVPAIILKALKQWGQEKE